LDLIYIIIYNIINELVNTNTYLKDLYSQQEYMVKLLDVMENFKDRVLSFQKQKFPIFDSVKNTTESNDDFSDVESIRRGTMSAIYDYLIDEASPLICGLIDDLISEGVSNNEPDLLFFRGVMLYNSDFLKSIPEKYKDLISGNKEIGNYQKFGLLLIKQVRAEGCVDEEEYLFSIGKN
ncbi:hypothetical protein BCR32DRAFT_84653, partial [Anaeromyces robustus]